MADRGKLHPDVNGSRAAHVGGQELALIVGAARSGTTLMRLILDAHPEIGCPAEAGVPALMSHMVGLWMTIDADFVQTRPGEDPGTVTVDKTKPPIDAAEGEPTPVRDPLAELPDEAREWIRSTVSEPMRRYNARGGKRLYVDKSLDSVYHLPLVDGLFPATRCVMVVRHVMDTIASGIEASPWGFQAYGYAPYVQSMPGNSVAALAQYWLTHVTSALSWEAEHAETCHRVRYEDLVLRPQETVARLLKFLDVAEDLSVLESAFRRTPPRGPGDYKVGHTRAVHPGSIGHGKRVPVGMLPPPLLEALNEKMEALGYPPVNSAWNTEERPVDLRGEGIWAERLSALMDAARFPPGRLTEVESFALVTEDHRGLRWIVEPESGQVTQGDGEVELVLTGTAEDLVLMLTGEENLGMLLRSGRIRHLTASQEGNQPEPPIALDQVVELLRERETFASERP